MKLLSALLVAATSQRIKDDYGSPKPEKAYNYEEAYGDPHFLVSSIGAEPICFDYNPEPGTQLHLLSDPLSSLVVTGTISDMQAGNKTYIDEILFMSPMGAQLTFNPLGVHLKGLSVREKIHQNDAETIKYGDIEFTEKWNDDGTRDRITVKIDDGPTFLIKAKVKKSSMSFGISDISGLSGKCKGILGNFIKEGSYHILPLSETTENGEPKAFIINDDMTILAIQKDFHKNHMCWTVDNDQVDFLLRSI